MHGCCVRHRTCHACGGSPPCGCKAWQMQLLVSVARRQGNASAAALEPRTSAWAGPPPAARMCRRASTGRLQQQGGEATSKLRGSCHGAAMACRPSVLFDRQRPACLKAAAQCQLMRDAFCMLKVSRVCCACSPSLQPSLLALPPLPHLPPPYLPPPYLPPSLPTGEYSAVYSSHTPHLLGRCSRRAAATQSETAPGQTARPSSPRSCPGRSADPSAALRRRRCRSARLAAAAPAVASLCRLLLLLARALRPLLWGQRQCPLQGSRAGRRCHPGQQLCRRRLPLRRPGCSPA